MVASAPVTLKAHALVGRYLLRHLKYEVQPAASLRTPSMRATEPCGTLVTVRCASSQQAALGLRTCYRDRVCVPKIPHLDSAAVSHRVVTSSNAQPQARRAVRPRWQTPASALPRDD